MLFERVEADGTSYSSILSGGGCFSSGSRGYWMVGEVYVIMSES